MRLMQPRFTELVAARPASEADRADGFDSALLVESSRFDSAAMLEELKELVTGHVADEPLRRLVLTLLERNAAALERRPATRDRCYPFVGGLLEHTLSVTRTCLLLAEHFASRYPEQKPPLNRDLIVAGAVLHDLGRVLELDDDAPAPSVTVPGRLAGHVVLGRDLVRDAAREQGDVNPELVQLLEHVVLAHLGQPEGGLTRPLVPECLIVYHADDLDGKLEMYARHLSRDAAPGPFTDRDPALGRRLLKGRTV